MSDAVFVLGVVFSIIFGFLLCIFLLIRPRNKLPPHVDGWPWVGNALQLNEKKMHITLSKFAAQYTVPMMSVNLFGDVIYVISNTELMTSFLSKIPKHFQNKYAGYRMSVIRNSWSLKAGVVRELDALVKKVELSRKNNMNEVLEQLPQFDLQQNNSTSGLCDIYEHIRDAVLNMKIVQTWGRSGTSAELAAYADLLKRHSSLTSSIPGSQALDRKPALRFIPGNCPELSKKYKELSRDILMWAESMAKAGNSQKTGALQDAAQHYSGASDAHVTSFLTSELCFSDDVYNVINVAYWFLKLVPDDLMFNLENELRHHGMTSGNEVWTRMPKMSSAVLEVFRFTCPQPLGVARVCDEATVLGRFWVEPGMQVAINYWRIMHDDQHWSNPYEFQPHRFLMPDSSRGSQRKLLPEDHESISTVSLILQNEPRNKTTPKESAIFREVLVVLIPLIRKHHMRVYMDTSTVEKRSELGISSAGVPTPDTPTPDTPTSDTPGSSCEDFMSSGLLDNTALFHVTERQ